MIYSVGFTGWPTKMRLSTQTRSWQANNWLEVHFTYGVTVGLKPLDRFLQSVA